MDEIIPAEVKVIFSGLKKSSPLIYTRVELIPLKGKSIYYYKVRFLRST
jgi:hypothetical protein